MDAKDYEDYIRLEGEVFALKRQKTALEGDIRQREAAQERLKKGMLKEYEEDGVVPDHPMLEIRRVPRKVIITDAALIPDKYIKPQEPVINKQAIRKACASGSLIPGTTLDNGGVTIAIKPMKGR